MNKTRCFGNGLGKEFYAKYHDEEWGIPVFDDRMLFEMLCLEGAQAGLSWETILKKRNGYKKCFKNFELEKVIAMTDKELEMLRQNSNIVRNKLKIFSVRKNAFAFIKIQQEFGSFSNYLWKYVDKKPVKNSFEKIEDIPTKTKLSDEISKDLKRRGMSFVGSTIIYAYLQAVGVVNDHITSCHCYKK